MNFVVSVPETRSLSLALSLREIILISLGIGRIRPTELYPISNFKSFDTHTHSNMNGQGNSFVIFYFEDKSTHTNNNA